MEGRRWRHAGASPASLRIGPGPTRPPVPLDLRKYRHNLKFPLSQEKKIKFFVISEMLSKTFVMVLKKLPDHLNVPLGNLPETEDLSVALEFPRIHQLPS